MLLCLDDRFPNCRRRLPSRLALPSHLLAPARNSYLTPYRNNIDNPSSMVQGWITLQWCDLELVTSCRTQSWGGQIDCDPIVPPTAKHSQAFLTRTWIEVRQVQDCGSTLLGELLMDRWSCRFRRHAWVQSLETLVDNKVLVGCWQAWWLCSIMWGKLSL